MQYYIETTKYGNTKDEVDSMANQKEKALMKRINELCNEKEMTYYGLSYKSAVPITTLLHIMDGSTKNPGIFTIMKLCDGLGVTLKEFFDSVMFETAIVEDRDEK